MVNNPQPMFSQYPVPSPTPTPMSTPMQEPSQAPMTVSALQAAMEQENPGQKFAFDADLDMSGFNTNDPIDVAKDLSAQIFASKAGVDPSEARLYLDDPEVMGTSFSINNIQKETVDAKSAGMGDSDIIRAISEKYAQGDAAEQDALNVLNKLKKGDKLDFKEGLAMLFAAVIPAVAGMAIGGTRTGMAGLAAGGQQILKNLQDKSDRNTAVGELEYKINMGKANRLRGEADAMRKSVMDESQYQARREDKINDKLDLARRMQGEGLGPKEKNTNVYMTPVDVIDGQRSTILAVKRIDDAINFMDSKIAKDGKFPEIVDRKLSEYKPDSPEREFAAKAKQIKLLAGKPMVKGALSDTDMADLEAIITGGKLASYELTRRRLLDMRDTLIQTADITNQLLPETNRGSLGGGLIDDLRGKRPGDWKQEGQSTASSSFEDRINAAEQQYKKGK